MLSPSIYATAEAYHLVIWVHSWYDGFVPAMRRRKELIMSQSKASGRKSVAGMGSIRKKEKVVNGKAYTYYEARYTVGIDLGTGKQIQKSISGKRSVRLLRN